MTGVADGLLILDEAHGRIPDGTRPLEVGRPRPFLVPSYVDPVRGRELECWYVRWAARWELPVPAHCRRRIVRGDHYLTWLAFDTRNQPTGQSTVYCAACAVAAGHWWDVREVTL